MDLLTFHLQNVNWWAVVFATLIGWLVGAVWYSPVLFAKPWQKAMGLKAKDLKGSNAVPFIGSAVATFVAAAGIATLMCALDFDTWQQGGGLGLLVGLVLVGGLNTLHCLFDRRKGSSTVYFIDTAYDVLLLAIIGGVYGAL